MIVPKGVKVVRGRRKYSEGKNVPSLKEGQDSLDKAVKKAADFNAEGKKAENAAKAKKPAEKKISPSQEEKGDKK